MVESYLLQNLVKSSQNGKKEKKNQVESHSRHYSIWPYQISMIHLLPYKNLQLLP